MNLGRLSSFFSKRKKARGGVVARFDVASTTADNSKHWGAADSLSADAATNLSVRRTLRNRSRYEVANNSYAKGIVVTLANDTIGTGPRLQMLTNDERLNSEIEEQFAIWSDRIHLAEKLRTMRMARCQDGESFGIMCNNPNLSFSPVKLDLQVIETDCVSDEQAVTTDRYIDGIKFDEYGNPVSYHVLKLHPGSVGEINVDNPNAFRVIPAENMIHIFRQDRPGLHRGIPELTPALPLFAQLRRYTLAVLTAAEAAADFSGIIYTDTPAGGESDQLEALDPIQLQRNMLLTMPNGWKMGQLDPKQPTATYGEFKTQILNEIARCLNMPFNIAAGNSAGYNYASGRLDWQTYFRSIKVDQRYLGSNVLDPLFRKWIREYSLSTRKDIDVNVWHTWFWDGTEHVDPLKEANAQSVRLASRTTTYAAEFARAGIDWEDAFDQIAKEKKRMDELGISPADIFPAVPEANTNSSEE